MAETCFFFDLVKDMKANLDFVGITKRKKVGIHVFLFERARTPRVFGDKFGDKFVTKFSDKLGDH